MNLQSSQIVNTVHLMLMQSIKSEWMLVSFSISFVVTSILWQTPLDKYATSLALLIPSTYLFFVARTDQTKNFSLFYTVTGIDIIVQVVAKILFLQLLVNFHLILLIAFLRLLHLDESLLPSLEISFMTIVYTSIILCYRKFRLLATSVSIILATLSYVLILTGLPPYLLTFNINCIILMLILITEEHES